MVWLFFWSKFITLKKQALLNGNLISFFTPSEQKQFRMKDLGDLRYFIGIEEYNPYCGYIDHEPTEALELICSIYRHILLTKQTLL